MNCAAYVADRPPVVFTEVGDGLEVRCQPTRQPHQLDIALRLALQAAAGLDTVQVAVDVDLQQHRGVVGGPPSCRRRHPSKPSSRRSSCINKDVNHSHRIVLRPHSPQDTPAATSPGVRSSPSINRFMLPPRRNRFLQYRQLFAFLHGLGRRPTFSGPSERPLSLPANTTTYPLSGANGPDADQAAMLRAKTKSPGG